VGQLAPSRIRRNYEGEHATVKQQTIEWRRGPDLPLPRGGYYAAWHDGGLWLAGGTYWEGGQKHWSDLVNFYDPHTAEWSRRGVLPRPMAYGAMAKSQGRLYLLGGADADEVYGDIYRLERDAWERVGQMPDPLAYGAVLAVGPHLYVCGGTRSMTDLTQATRAVWRYDVESGDWREQEPMPGAARMLPGSASMGDSVYIFGGCTQSTSEPLRNLGDALRFDSATGRWLALKDLPEATRAWGVAPVGGGLYLCGGYGDHFLDSVYHYDVGSDAYHLVSRLPAGLADCKFFYADGALYAAGGEDAPARRFAGTLIGRVR
jgi:N-acetylneuraminic acid mutarotase